jgi:hypothetical protein
MMLGEHTAVISVKSAVRGRDPTLNEQLWRLLGPAVCLTARPPVAERQLLPEFCVWIGLLHLCCYVGCKLNEVYTSIIINSTCCLCCYTLHHQTLVLPLLLLLLVLVLLLLLLL